MGKLDEMLEEAWEPVILCFADKKEQWALVAVAQLVGASSHNQRVAGSIPSLGIYNRQPVDASLSLKAMQKKKKVVSED